MRHHTLLKLDSQWHLTRAGPTPSQARPLPFMSSIGQKEATSGSHYYVLKGYPNLSLAFGRKWLGGPGPLGALKEPGKGSPPCMNLQEVPPRPVSLRERYRSLINVCGCGPEPCKLSPGSLLGGGAWRRPWSGLPWGGSVRCLSSHPYPFLASPQTVRQRVGGAG